MQAQRLGGTCFFDAVLECLQQLGQASSAAPPDAPRWLVCLTDGDDLGSRRDNTHGELVTRALEAKVAVGILRGVSSWGAEGGQVGGIRRRAMRTA